MTPGYLQWSSVAPWAILFGLTGLTCAAMALPAWRQRHRPGAAYAAALMAAAAIYSFLYGLELQAPTLGQQIFWAKLEYFGAATLPLAWFFFARSYTGAPRPLRRWAVTLLCVIPVTTILLVVTNELHGFFWGEVSLRQVSPGDRPIAVYEHEPWYWVQVTYAYILMLAGSVRLVQALFQYPSRYRWRAAPLLLGALAPWTGNALYAFGVRPAGGVDLTALAFSVTAVCVMLSLARFDLLRLSPSLLPVARGTLFEQMKDLVLAVDVDQRVVWANRSAGEALDLQGHKLAGRPLCEIMPEMAIASRFAEGETAELPLEVSLTVGDARHIYDVADTPLRLGPNQAVGRLLVLRDITERRRAEAALQASEERLRQSQRMEAIGRLAGGIAHDFNNLLTVILGYGEMILMCEDRLSDSARRDLNHMKKAAEKAQTLTSQILAFSRRQPRDVRRIRADRLVEDVAPLLERALGENIDVVIRPAARDAIVHADPGQLTQVFMNLAVNARDAMSHSGTLTIDTDVAGDSWRVRVSDTSPGFDEETLQHLFEPFFTTKSQAHGAGLGLATVYGIVKQSNGDITASCPTGGGTTYEILLPIGGFEADESVSAVEGGLEETAPAKDGAGDATRAGAETTTIIFVDDDSSTPVILLVEDEPEVRDLAARTLRDAGYEVLTAPDGPDALEIAHARHDRIDLLLSDVVLPRGLSGDEVAKVLQSERPDTKVLLVSGYAADSTAYTDHRASGAFYLDKPFTPESLAGKVREILHR